MSLLFDEESAEPGDVLPIPSNSTDKLVKLVLVLALVKVLLALSAVLLVAGGGGGGGAGAASTGGDFVLEMLAP